MSFISVTSRYGVVLTILVVLQSFHTAHAGMNDALGVVRIDASSGLVHLATSKLTGNVGYNLKKMHKNLDQLDKFLKETTRPKSVHRRAKGYLEEAEGNYKKITDYELGKFDQSHPDWLSGTKRLEDSRIALANYHSEFVLGKTATPKAPQIAAVPDTSKPQPKTPTQTAAPQNTDVKSTGPLNSIVASELKKVIRFLDFVDKIFAADMDSGAAGKVAKIKPALADASLKLDSIRKDFADKFNQQHPDFIAVISRQAAAEKSLAAFRVENSGQLAAQATYASLSSKNKQIIGNLRGIMSILNAAPLNENGFEFAKSQLARAEENHKTLASALQNEVSANDPVLLEINTLISNARTFVGQIPTRIAAKNATENSVLNAKYSSKIKTIETRFKDLGMTSNLHREHIGKIIWSRNKKALADGSLNQLGNRFALSDPIFGSAFLPRSLGNTAVFSKQTGVPYENAKFAYELHLFINDQEVTLNAGRFGGGALPPKYGKAITVIPVTPNPVPVNTGFYGEAETWRKITTKLPIGEYKVRAELWGGQHQRMTKAPIAEGQFTLTKAKGERILARGKYPKNGYGAGDITILKGQIAKNRVGLGDTLNTILKIWITDEWAFGAFTDTKQTHRTLPVSILYADIDGDGVCTVVKRFFRSRLAGTNNWSVLRQVANVGGATIDVECPK